ncbi:MAG: hypothetical protein LBE74_06970 [Treponema sp.]|jgi:hypothetical protein|nr:hypothetical protein [Treponema sp.]
MKKVCIALLALALVGAAWAKDRLAILPFTGGQGEDGETIAELFSFEKEIKAAFDPVPRTSINTAIRNEQRFQTSSGMTDPDTIAALGKQLGAQYVVSGTFTALGGQKLLVIAILKIDELRQVAGDVQTYNNMSEIRGKLSGMAKIIVAASKRDASRLPRLATPPVRLSEGASEREADTLAQILAVYLIRSRKYAVYPRTMSLEQVQKEYGNQFSGDVADEYLPILGKGNNPRLVLAVAGRKLDDNNMFNAAIINLVTGVQEVVATVDYESLEDGIQAMEDLALKLTGKEKQVQARIAKEEAARKKMGQAGKTAETRTKFNYTIGDAETFTRSIAAINADSAGGVYTLTLTGNFVINPVVFTSNAVKTIEIRGDSSTRTLWNNGGGALFTTPRGITLALGNNITLNGNNKAAPIVSVKSGTLTMRVGSVVRGARQRGVSVENGLFMMEGGTISGNNGGVSVFDGGRFTMSGGTISENKATSDEGGGVSVRNGNFTMTGGIISGNSANNSYYEYYGYGGGVFISDGSFIKSGGGTIDATNSATRGRVVYIKSNNGDKQRNNVAGPSVNLDSRVNGATGGWE